ncbi:MAG: TrbI/VirB10 family protein [Verrucomicrobiaceae bacterium]|nr:TrbI/VirB10 family protein [Verrucomicrobiaceae bacterium]
MLQHFQKPAVQMLLLLVVVGIGGAAYFVSKQPPSSVNATANPKDEKTGAPAPKTTLVAEDKTVNLGEKRTAKLGSDDQVERFIVPPKKPPPPSLVSGPVSNSSKKPEKAPPFPTLVHVNSSPKEPFVPSVPRLFAPRGILIKAALVITVDSSSIQTPVLGLVVEDVYWNHQLVLPAGTQVHAKAGGGRTRDRIEVKGNFTFIWDDGREYSISGIALDHEKLTDGTFAVTDGSAGIRGRVIKNDEYAEVKILIAEALQGIMNNNQQQFQTIYGLAPQNTTRNAALGGGSQAASAYSGMLTQKLSQDLDFVRVAAGTTFYIYTLDVFEPEMASIAGLKQGGQPVSSWQLAQAAHAQALADGDATVTRDTERAAEMEKTRQQQQASEQINNVRQIIATPTGGSSSSSSGGDTVRTTLDNPSPTFPAVTPTSSSSTP